MTKVCDGDDDAGRQMVSLYADSAKAGDIKKAKQLTISIISMHYTSISD